MAIMNYTTEVPAERTVGEITSLLVRKGARSISTEFTGEGELKAITFVMPIGGFPVCFQLPANVDGVARVMLTDKPWTSRSHGTKEQFEAKARERAKWVAWRILKDWVAAQVALIESGQAQAAQVFMPYAMQDDGRTMFQLFTESNQKRLSKG